MACGKYNCARANNQSYQAGYMASTYSPEVPGASVPYHTSSQTTYQLPAGSVGMAGSYN